jgi:hypothetical protein
MQLLDDLVRLLSDDESDPDPDPDPDGALHRPHPAFDGDAPPLSAITSGSAVTAAPFHTANDDSCSRLSHLFQPALRRSSYPHCIDSNPDGAGWGDQNPTRTIDPRSLGDALSNPTPKDMAGTPTPPRPGAVTSAPALARSLTAADPVSRLARACLREEPVREPLPAEDGGGPGVNPTPKCYPFQHHPGARVVQVSD